MLRIRPALGQLISPLVAPTAVAVATGKPYVPPAGPAQASTMPMIAKVGLGAALVGLVAYAVTKSRKPQSSRRSRSASDRPSGVDGTVENFLAVLSSKLTQYDERVSRRERMPNIYRLGHYMKALGDVRDKVAGILERSDPEALTALKAVINRHFHDLPPTNNVLKQIDAWLASGKRPSLVR
jgi:hypothetical protein